MNDQQFDQQIMSQFEREEWNLNINITKETRIETEYFQVEDGRQLHITIEGPPVSSTILDKLIAYYERDTEKEGKSLRFSVYNMAYQHPSYLELSGIHSKEPFSLNEQLFPLVHSLHAWFREEEKRDLLFSWSIYPNRDQLDIYWVKGGLSHSISVECTEEKLYVHDHAQSKSIECRSLDECYTYITTSVDQLYRKRRLDTVFDLPWYYTKKHLKGKGMDDAVVDEIIHHLSAKHEEEELELYFKQRIHEPDVHYRSPAFHHHGLIQLMGEWLFYTPDSYSWHPLCESKKVISLFEQHLLQLSLGAKQYDSIQFLKTSP